jgi:hypothetical protein
MATYAEEIRTRSPTSMSDKTRLLRETILHHMERYTSEYSKAIVDENLFVLVDKNHNIIGFDICYFLGVPTYHYMTNVKVGSLNIHNWIIMKI